MFIVAIKSYVYLVPYVETDKDIFLKIIIPISVYRLNQSYPCSIVIRHYYILYLHQN